MKLFKNKKTEHKITDLEKRSQYLGINIKRSERGIITLDQEQKNDELKNKFILKDMRPYSLLINPGYEKSNIDDNLLKNSTSYRQGSV